SASIHKLKNSANLFHVSPLSPLSPSKPSRFALLHSNRYSDFQWNWMISAGTTPALSRVPLGLDRTVTSRVKSVRIRQQWDNTSPSIRQSLGKIPKARAG